jgi:hypothetical protein
MIVSCGKTINFLRRNEAASPIVNFAPKILTDPIELIMTPDQVKSSKQFRPHFVVQFCFIVFLCVIGYHFESIGFH